LLQGDLFFVCLYNIPLAMKTDDAS